MIKLNWTINHVKTKNDIINLINDFNRVKPDYSGLDTETTGLHIILDKPFVITFGWYNESTKEASAFGYDLTANPLLNSFFFKTLYPLLGKTKKMVGHNVKYDLHMLANIGYKYPHDNVTDSQLFIRLAHDALVQSEGGPPLNLTDYAYRYIDPNAKIYHRAIRAEGTKLVTARTEKIKKAGFKIADIDKILSDKLNDITNLDPRIQEIYRTSPDPDNYSNYDREIVLEYACWDVIYTLEIHHHCKPIVIHREQMNIIEREETLIPIYWEMERHGFKLNKKYALETKERLRNYILERRNDLYNLLGVNLKIGQHKALKEWFYTQGVEVSSTNNEALTELTYHSNELVSNVAKLIIELRTLEKWYSTYIIKWTAHLDKTDRIYTQINQAGAVSGRVTSDFQQFPKSAIYDKDGNELFHPRKLVTVSKNGYNSIVYLDYSQIELRLQALYTIYVMGGDINLCRAYMPFKCTNGEFEFDHNNPEHLKTFENYKWFLCENPSVLWKSTDLHTLTASNAFPHLLELDPNSEEYSRLRAMGKSTNFACNYGANANTLHKQFGYPYELALKLFNAYNTVYPGVLSFKKYIQDFLRTKPYIENLFGRRYYGANAHKCSNYVIQGSGADLLKIKIIETAKFLKDNNLKSKFQMNIHDELSFEIYDGEEFIIPKLKEIMEDLPGTKVPIKVGVDITHTTWAEAKKVNL